MKLLAILLLKNLITNLVYLGDSAHSEDHFLVVMLLVGTAFLIVTLIIGVILGLIFIAIIVGLISATLISTSVLVGFQQKSITKGFKTFFIITSVLGCSIISIAFFWFINVSNEYWDTNTSIIAGAICGIISGYVIGLLMYSAIKRVLYFLKEKYFIKE